MTVTDGIRGASLKAAVVLTKTLFGLNQDSCRILVAQCSFSSLLVKLQFFSIGFV